MLLGTPVKDLTLLIGEDVLRKASPAACVGKNTRYWVIGSRNRGKDETKFAVLSRQRSQLVPIGVSGITSWQDRGGDPSGYTGPYNSSMQLVHPLSGLRLWLASHNLEPARGQCCSPMPSQGPNAQQGDPADRKAEPLPDRERRHPGPPGSTR